MKTVIKNIAELIQTEKTPRKWVAGEDMKNISTIKDAFVEVENGIITAFGSMKQWTGIEDWNNKIIPVIIAIAPAPIKTPIRLSTNGKRVHDWNT